MRSITESVTLLVLAAGLLHALWNAMAKSFHDQWESFTLIALGSAIPSVVALPFVGVAPRACWGYLAAAVFCHLTYELFLMSAYRHGTLSRSYPIARGVAPLLTALGGLVFANERIGVVAIGGILLVVGGVLALALLNRAATSARAVRWALATGVAIAVYTVIDGLGVRTSHQALRYTVTLMAIQSVIFIMMAFVRRPHRDFIPRRLLVRGVSAGAISLVAYGLVLWAQTRAPLGVVSALRETGVLWAAVIGVLFFKERGGWRVIAAGAVILSGVATIALV